MGAKKTREILACIVKSNIRSHLIGDEKLFGFAGCVKSSLKSAYFWCVDFRDPTAFSRIMPLVGKSPSSWRNQSDDSAN